MIVAATLIAPSIAHAQSTPWMQSRLSPARRAALLLAAMTLDEKLQQLVGAPGVIAEIPSCYGARHVPGIARLGIPTFRITNGPVGVGQNDCVPANTPNLPRAAMMSTASAEGDGAAVGDGGRRVVRPRRRGAVRRRDRQSSRATSRCTCSRGRGSTSPACRRAGATSSTSARIPSSPARWRVAEIRAMQKHGVIAMAKHFVANEHETNRTTENAIVDDRVLHELYLLPFEMAVKERRGRVGDVLVQPRERPVRVREPSPPHRRAARRSGGSSGYVQSDFFAVHSARRRRCSPGWTTRCRASHSARLHAAGSRPASCRPRSTGARSRSEHRHRAGAAIPADVPARASSTAPVRATPIDVARNAAIAREIGEQSAVLLKNDGATAAARRAVASIGRADRPGRVRDEGGRRLLRRQLGRHPVRHGHAARRREAGARAVEVAGDGDAHRRRERQRQSRRRGRRGARGRRRHRAGGHDRRGGARLARDRAGERPGRAHPRGRGGEPAHGRRAQGQRVDV